MDVCNTKHKENLRKQKGKEKTNHAPVSRPQTEKNKKIINSLLARTLTENQKNMYF